MDNPNDDPIDEAAAPSRRTRGPRLDLKTPGPSPKIETRLPQDLHEWVMRRGGGPYLRELARAQRERERRRRMRT